MAESAQLCSSFCLGLPDWTDCCHEQNNAGTSKDAGRFSYIEDSKVQQLSRSFTPKKTETNTKWAFTNFQEWKAWRNTTHPDDPVTANFVDASVDELDKWLARYVAETRNKKGEFYTPSTLRQLLCGLFRHMKNAKPDFPNFIDKKNPHFTQLHGTLDNLFRQLHEKGVGRQVKHSEIISSEEEEKLWSSGQLGTETPRALQNAVFFYNGKNFCIRGGEEHRNIKLSQFQRYYEPDRYHYIEYVSKNRLGTFRKQHVDSNVVPIYCTCQNGQSNVKDICQRAGIQGNKTNHSLQATGATAMYEAEVPESLIQERTGHRSLKALRVYERSTEAQHQAVSAVLSSRTTFHSEMSRSQATHFICSKIRWWCNF